MNLSDLLLRNIDLGQLADVDFYPNKMTSTYDKTGGNSDGGDFLRWQDGNAVICDVKGPGAIVRFYVARCGGTLRFFFDGEDTPRLEIDCSEFFSGQSYPFLTPLVDKRGLGWYCYFPFPFQESCRIECVPAEDGTKAIYCQATHIEFPEGTEVETYSPEGVKAAKDVLDKVIAAWKDAGEYPAGAIEGQQTQTFTLDVAAGRNNVFSTLRGSGVVDALYINLNSPNTDLLREVLLRVHWDGLMRPGIDSPIGDFFGNAFEYRPFRSLLTGLSESGEFYCYFPMPFADSAQFELVNDSAEHLKAVEVKIVYRETARPAENIGRFHAKFRREYCAEVDCFGSNLDGRYNYTILDAKGQGKYVGCSMNMVNSWARWWGEGDEMIFVDDDTWPPSHHGTGTEEYFNDAWGFHEGVCPVSAALLQGPLDGPSGHRCFGPNALFTHHIANALPFSKSIRVTIEHGTENDKSNDYATTAYWYQKVPGQDFFVMPRVEERRALGKEKWLEHYRIHRRALVADRLGKVRKYMQMFEDHPTTETNIEERVRALSWWQYFMRICALYIYQDRVGLVGMFKGEEYEALPFEQKAARVEKMAKLFKERTEEQLKECGEPEFRR